MFKGLPQMDGQTIENEFQEMQQRGDMRANHTETRVCQRSLMIARNRDVFNRMPSSLHQFDGHTVDDIFQDMLQGENEVTKIPMDMRKTEIDKVNRQSRCVDYINERNIDDSTLKRIHQDGNMQNTKQCTYTGVNNSTDVLKTGKMSKDITSIDERYENGIFTERQQGTQLELSKHQTDIKEANNAIMSSSNCMDVERRMMLKRLCSIDGHPMDRIFAGIQQDDKFEHSRNTTDGLMKSAPDSRSQSLPGQNHALFAGTSKFQNIRGMPAAHKEICPGCQHPIEDRFLMKLMDCYWHEQCVRCCMCQMALTNSCFSRNRKLYCKVDYQKLFRGACNGCGLHISPNELVMRAQGYVYHLQCFVCIECGQPLQRGDYFVIRDGQLFCRLDFEKEFHMYSMSPKSDDSDDYDDGESDGGKHPKRPRTILTTSQRRKFKSAFEMNPKPCRKVREQLAAETGLSVRVVQVWFQNQRAKVKKIARRQSQDGSSGKGNKNKNGDSKKEKSDGYKSDDSDPDSNGRLCDVDSIVSMSSDKHHHGNAEQISPLPASEYQESRFDEMDDSRSVRQAMEDNINCIDQMFMTDSHGHSAMDTGNVLNPIDKLYSMQNSYFSVE